MDRASIPAPIDDDMPPNELAGHVERLHGVPARFVEAVEVKETHDGRLVGKTRRRVEPLRRLRAQQRGCPRCSSR
jgi:hypothetical protein